MDPKRMVIVFAVTFILMIVVQTYLFKTNKPSPSAREAAANQQQQSTGTQPAAPGNATQPAAATPAKSASPQSKQASAEQKTVVENDLFRIEFTNKGGQVTSWILKKYKDERGNPLELVHTPAASQYGWPLSLWTWDAALKDKLNSALYVTDAAATVNAPGKITFEYADGDLEARKTFSFDESYVVTVDTEVKRGGATVTALPAWPAGFGDVTIPATYAQQRIDYMSGEDLKRLSADKKGKSISGNNVLQGPISWGGALDQYFAAIFLPDQPRQATLATLRYGIEVPKDAKKPEGEKQHLEVLGAAVGPLNAPVRERLFVGPKNVDVLGSIRANGPDGQPLAGPDLRSTLDFGMFSIIARPLFAWAKWTQQHWVSNWGWCIVLLTVIINLVLLPLRISSMKSMLKMQKIQPQIKVIQDKYKKYKLNDPKRQEMNQEMWALQKEHGVNPMGGCLPIIIQMPFLFAFYAMLANVTELRQAGWLWIRDLSAPDPYFIIPVLVIVTQLLLQRMSPSGGMDPQQQRMMNVMMPLMIGLFSWSVASGLGVYWITGVVVMIIQQLIMNRTALGREIREAAAKRAAQKK